ncbi:hypothetical protein NPIL_405631 [Nephila pilipes]|uniref:Uncharacterized protein n=1 Tax=Nephila pilipes TaxID=299642 RepID=A0A8X6PEE8_NEPPI|nr:hypothetical protein NPIL_405631 [Nephila pilipes]
MATITDIEERDLHLLQDVVNIKFLDAIDQVLTTDEVSECLISDDLENYQFLPNDDIIDNVTSIKEKEEIEGEEMTTIVQTSLTIYPFTCLQNALPRQYKIVPPRMIF